MNSLKLDLRFMSFAFDDVGSGFRSCYCMLFRLTERCGATDRPLSAAGFRLLVPDLPEFGDTTPGTEVFTIERARMSSPSFEAIDVEKAVVGGLDGRLCRDGVRAGIRNAAGLILADTKAAPDDAEAKAKRDQLIADVKGTGPVAAAEALLPKLFSTKTRQLNPAVIDEARTIVLRQRSAAIIAGLYALRDRPDAMPGLAGVSVPTLVIVGEEDSVTPPLAAARIAGSIRGSELVHIPNAGHISNLENPEAFNSAVLAFLKKLT